MSLRLIAAPEHPPVTLAQAKGHLRVDHPDDDFLISTYIEAAVGRLDGADGILGRSLVNQTWALDLDRFPVCGPITIPLSPLRSVVSVKYFDPGGWEQLLPAEHQVVHPGLGLLELQPGRSWPSTYGRRRAVTIEFLAGYGPATKDDGAPLVPGPLRSAILLMVGDLYANRETGVVGTVAAELKTSMTVDRLTAPYRVFRP